MANVANRSFAGGELAPQLYARTDLAKYAVGLRQCRNFMVMRQGGAAKRPGTLYVNTVKDSTKRVRLIPFVFSSTDALVLEFGDKYIRFYQNGGVVVDPSNTAIPYEIASPYAAIDLPQLKYVQRADIVTIVHPRYAPQELKRFGDANWTIGPITFGAGIAAPTGVTVGDVFSLVPTGITPGTSRYVVTSISSAGEESLASVPVTSPHIPQLGVPEILHGTATGADSYNIYRSDTGAEVYGWVGTGDGTSISFIDTGFIPDYTRQPPIDKGLFKSQNDYPSVVAYYQQRLVFANSTNNPDTIWTSRTGFYHNFNVSAYVQDDDAITFRLTSEEIDSVQHILNVGRMIVLTTGAEWIVEGDGNGVLTPTSVNARIGATDGVNALRPIKVANQLLFLQALGSQIRQIQANVQFGYYSLTSADVTIYSSHLVDGFQITDWTWQQVYPHVLWAVRSDGVLLGLTYIPEQEVLAWHRHDTKGFVESVCAIPENGEHFVYWVARRHINGSFRRYIEKMTTSIQLPVVLSPEDAAATGGIITPPAPPPAPPPATQPIAPPTSPSTTDVTSTAATANWFAGNTSAQSSVEIRKQGDTTWTAHVVAAGVQSFRFTGLSSGVAYEWRVAHFIGSTFSDYLGPSAPTQFTTTFVTPTLTDPASAPTITVLSQVTGLTIITIAWLASGQAANANVQIAGPTSISPTDGEFTQIGSGNFVSTITSAPWNITASGDYWVRVRYELDGFNNSQFVESVAIPLTVL